MNNQNTVTIYEFSDKIQYDYVDGQLRSRGFGFGFMNSTLDPIPDSIKIAIDNKYFAVKCAKSNSDPALVARMIQEVDRCWSVIAVVSRIKDDGGRSLEISRYFVAEGEDSLWKIIEYLNNFKNNKGQYPIFNPKINMKQPITFSLNNTDAPQYDVETSFYESISNNHGLLQPQHYRLQELNYLAKFLGNQQNYAWAYNVANLEQPHSFNLIVPEDASAYENIYNFFQAPQLVHAPVPNYGFNEDSIKRAVQSLISGSFTSRYVQRIGEAIVNENIVTDNWHQVFNKEKADKAISENLQSDRMARLLTLRGTIVPEMLVELLQWLELGENKQYWSDVLEFSQQFYRSFEEYQEAKNKIKKNITKGIYLVLLKLLKQEINVESLVKLLTNHPWKKFTQYLFQNIHNDLAKIGRNISILDEKELSCGTEIWKQLINDRQNNYQLPWRDVMLADPNRKYRKLIYYKPFSQLFWQLEEKQLFAYFYQVSQGNIPVNAKVFQSIFTESDSFQHTFYGLKIYRQISKVEQINKLIVDELNAQRNLNIKQLFFLGLIPLFLGFLFGEAVKPIDKIASVGTSVSQSVGNLCIPFITTCQDKITKQELNNALAKFDETIKSLGAVFTDSQWKLTPPEKKKETIIKTICGKKDCLEWGESMGKLKAPKKQKWIKKIWNYQQKNGIKADGIIGDETRKKILAQIDFPESPSPEASGTPDTSGQNPEKFDIQPALNAFETTKTSIKDLVETPASTILYQNPETAIDKMKLIFDRSPQDLESDVILGSNDDENAKKKWIIAIYKYQQELREPDGKVDASGDTIKYLTVDLLFKTTQQAIQTLVEEVATQTGQDKNDVKAELKKLLDGKPENISLAIEGTKQDDDKNRIVEIKNEQFALIEAIKTYEESNSATIQIPADGLIQKNDPTYNDLSSKIVLAFSNQPLNTNIPSGQ